MAEPLDLVQARMYIEEARGFIPEDGDPEAYIAAALQDAEVAIDELEASRAAGDQLRATLDDLIRWARAGTLHRSPAVGGYDKEKFDEVDRLASNAVRLLDVIQSPPRREPQNLKSVIHP
jgi:hypothetical protein